MKQYAVADEVPESSEWYLTAGKEYLVFEVDGMDAIQPDTGDFVIIFIDGSSHLDGKPWRIVERES